MDDKYGFASRFRKMSDQELIDAFNHDFGNTGWVSARAIFLFALRKEYNCREFDYSAFSGGQGFSFPGKIKLEGKRIVLQDV